jgi:SAM-dependent methyltransferase
MDETLEKRHISEIDFHNKKYDENKESHYKSNISNILMTKVWEMMGDISGKMVVDYGCGTGWVTKKLLQKGAKVFAFDISQKAVKITKEVAESINLDANIQVEQMPAEKLNYEDNRFDIVLGVAILHHLDLDVATKEIKRVLKKGGKAYFLEPLRHNPLINMFRKLTPNMRSEDELPLHFRDFEIFKREFSKFEHQEYYLFSIFSFVWHFLIRSEKLFKISQNIFMRVDKVVLRIFPFLKRYCWYSILIMEK